VLVALSFARACDALSAAGRFRVPAMPLMHKHLCLSNSQKAQHWATSPADVLARCGGRTEATAEELHMDARQTRPPTTRAAGRAWSAFMRNPCTSATCSHHATPPLHVLAGL
jgi:hypothetical protein